jgi:MoxR-like ATPase
MPQQSGIYEALLEKAERDAAELADRLSGLELSTAKQLAELERERDEAREQLRLANIDFFNTQTELEEQARLLGKGGSREARLITERDHYKQALEEVSSSIDDWLNSLIQEPSLDFIHAIKAWADKKLKEI